MANLGNSPGDGKKSPFGDGNGKEGSGPMSGNNFVQNPHGSASGTKPRDFITGPAEMKGQSKAQDESDPQSRAAGPRTAAEAVTKTDDAGNPVGTGVQGAAVGGKPFKLGGA